jgi:hypothetical protein
MSGQCWLRQSLGKLRLALIDLGHCTCCETLRRLLRQHNIRPKSNVKHLAPKSHPDRDQQFQYIQSQRQVFRALGWPIISVDTKKKELIGLFHNRGQVWCEEACGVYTHDFPSDATGQAVPYGVYDTEQNAGHVYVGQSSDTPQFAVQAIRTWWRTIGCQRYPQARDILILADSGGSNSARSRGWKQQLQTQFADAFGITITGASKWNPIEHRLFSQISRSWAGVPLTTFDQVLQGIRRTRTQTGLTVGATLMPGHYETGVKVTDQQMDRLALERHAACPQWNYTITPRKMGCNL